MKPLIFGAKGMVGTALVEAMPECVAWDREDVDATNFQQLSSKLKELKGQVSVVINCVAYNNVDEAETRPEVAYNLNTRLPGELAGIVNEMAVPLVHFSSGYVFDGEKESYAEADLPNPLSIYGNSKYLGENAVREKAKQYYIVRTNVVFGKAGSSGLSKKSFVDLVLGLAERQNTVRLIEDEVNSLTFAEDLAKSIKAMLMSKPESGVYHIVNEGFASWYEFGKEILKGRTHVTVEPIKAAIMPRPAKRPKRAVLQNTKLPKLRNWKEALTEYLKI